MNNDVKMLKKILNDLNEEKLLDNLILIGSWAEFLYENNNLIKGSESTTKTTDIDFLVPNINKPRKKVSLPMVLKEKGYNVMTDRHTGVNKFSKGNFEIEFLARQIGKPSNQEIVPALDIKVETLTHMYIIYKNIISTKYNDLDVIIPSAEAFVIGKMIINEDRTEEKREKDKISINNMIITMIDNKENMNKLIEICNEDTTKKEKKKILKYIKQNNIPIDIEEWKREEDI